MNEDEKESLNTILRAIEKRVNNIGSFFNIGVEEKANPSATPAAPHQFFSVLNDLESRLLYLHDKLDEIDEATEKIRSIFGYS